MGEIDKAISDCLEALRLDPQDRYRYHVFTMLGDCCFRQHDFDRAIGYYTQALELNSTFDYAYAWRGAARCHIGQCDAAVADYDEAIRLAPNNAAYYSARGNAHSCAGKHDLAMKDHDKAFELAR
jgi:tetratricopeptide (TPR) repeat protein